MRWGRSFGHSSKTNPKNVWNPPHNEDIARLTNMKKNRNENKGGTSICKTAAGYEMKASPIPPFTTYEMKLKIMNMLLMQKLGVFYSLYQL